MQWWVPERNAGFAPDFLSYRGEGIPTQEPDRDPR
jgi:hypothetical protein